MSYATAISGLQNIDDVWMIGDSIEADFMGAKRFGWKAVLVRKPHPDATHFSTGLADIHTKLERS